MKPPPLPDIEMWSDNVLTDKALLTMIEASNAYALCAFKDPVNDIYSDMLMSVAGYIPQLLSIAVEARKKGLTTMKPQIIIVGADKGGVGKTTVSRALLDYLEINNRGSDATRAFDTEPEPGVLKRFYPDKTEIVDFTISEGLSRVLDTLKTALITVIDTKAGILSDTLNTLDNIGYLDKVKAGEIKLAVLHVLGGNSASFNEIKTTAEKLTHARHFLIKNQINDNSFFKWNPEMTKFLAGGTVDVPKLDALAGEHVDAASIGFAKFVADEARSETLRGYVRHWLNRVYQSFDLAGLNAL